MAWWSNGKQGGCKAQERRVTLAGKARSIMWTSATCPIGENNFYEERNVRRMSDRCVESNAVSPVSEKNGRDDVRNVEGCRLVAYAFHPGAWKADIGTVSWFPGQPGLHSD